LIKKVIFALLQFLLFLVVFAVGTFVLPLLNISYVTSWANGTRGFEWDGILLMLAISLLIIVIEALRKRLRSAAPWTTMALALAAIIGLAMKFGFKDLQP
jgi:hypothetical protein